MSALMTPEIRRSIKIRVQAGGRAFCDPAIVTLWEHLEAVEKAAAEDTARLNIIANNAGTVISELLNGNDEEDEFPEGFRVEMILNGKAYTAEAVELRDALDELRADAAIDAARKESR